MPIITPAYPAMCATHNVSESTQIIMTEEFKRGQFLAYCSCLQKLMKAGADIVDKVIVGTATWSELFAKHDFFHKYRYYLQVIASTDSPDVQIKWLRCCFCISLSYAKTHFCAGLGPLSPEYGSSS